MKKMLVLLSLFLFCGTAHGQVNFQVGMYGEYTDFPSHSATGYGGSAKVALLLHQVVALGAEAGYMEYSFDKSEVAIYGTAVLYLRTRGIRPFVSYGIGHHRLSGYYIGNIPFELGYEPKTYWDTRTGMGVRVGGGVQYALLKALSIDCSVLYENQKQLIDNLRVRIGVKRVF